MKYLPHFFSFLAFFLVVAKINYDKNPSTDSPEPSTPARTIDDGPSPEPIISYNLPDSLSFAGEQVPLQMPDVRERLDKELHINAYWQTNTLFLLKRAHRWLPRISEILKRNGIPEDFKYLPLVESALLNDVSPKSAAGFWQIGVDSGRELGLEVSREVDQRYDPLLSTEAACKYLKKAYDRFGDWTLVAASYNRGMRGISDALSEQKVTSFYDLYLNDETSRYLFRVLAIKEIMLHPHRYGFYVDPSQLYNAQPVHYVEVDETIPDLAQYALDQGSNYKILKRFNPWLQSDQLRVRHGKHYRIALPDPAD